MPKLSFPAFFICENAKKMPKLLFPAFLAGKMQKNAICESHDSQSATRITNYVLCKNIELPGHLYYQLVI